MFSYLQQGATLQNAMAVADRSPLGMPIDTTTHMTCPHPVKGDLNMTLHGTVYNLRNFEYDTLITEAKKL